ncbi:hypothetical protein [Paraliomyxa miuraensis]|uniref:hypothetical protein n=1 Tax=Paraliomyxa miuraensis TaxID=376150 RepID=UPI0022580B08|nr:hypothetical protein [Paraliomyxa miuraensis]MCX4245718.1 hypothetical protein [Paraliomyxa miuraensis]
MAATPESIEAELAALEDRCQAWREAWAERERTPCASVGEVLSAKHLAEPLAERIVERLVEGRREIENAIARLAATTAGATARLTRDGDTSALERRLHEIFLRIGKHEEHFDTKLAELRPLVQRHLRLARALRPTPGA